MDYSRRDADAEAYGARAGRGNRLARALATALGLLLAAGTAAAEIRIAALGDSLTQGYGLRAADAFAPRLEAWLRDHGVEDAMVINAGVSGDTTAGGRARVDWVLADEPDAVIVALGGNDILRGINPATTRENLDAILAAVEARGLPVLLAGLPGPENYGAAYREAFEAIWPALAAEYDALLYPNFMAGIGERLEDGRARGMMQDDGIHPNAAGVAAMVEHIGPVVLDLIERVGDAPRQAAEQRPD
jgi:acyl-CoA thioesterase I